MLKKIKYLTGDQLSILISMVNTDIDIILNGGESKKQLKYENILMDSSRPENNNVDFLVENIIDQLMFDSYNIYIKIKDKIKENDLTLENYPDKEYKKIYLESKKYIEDFINLYESIILNSKFEYGNIRQIQKFFLNEKLQKLISLEKYEDCIDIKKKLEDV